VLSGRPEVSPAPAAPVAPADLPERLAALESGTACGEDFDRASWIWLWLLGVAVPVLLLLAGWWAG
jgi:hypothetical protein